jgi:hypothetical protein
VRAQLDIAAQQTNSAVADLTALGVPIAWNEQRAASLLSAPVMTVIGLLLGGLLIGLGAPFWYRSVQTLTGFRSTARDTQDAATAVGANAAPAGEAQRAPATPIEAFHAAFGAVVATGDFRIPEEAVG